MQAIWVIHGDDNDLGIIFLQLKWGVFKYGNNVHSIACHPSTTVPIVLLHLIVFLKVCEVVTPIIIQHFIKTFITLLAA